MPSEKRSKRILVLCPYPMGCAPGQRLKFEQYYDSWRANGFEVEVSPFMSDEMQKIVYKKGHLFAKIAGTIRGYLRRYRDLFRVGKYDIVYVFLWITPFGPAITEWLIRARAKKMVYDIDDLVYMGRTSRYNKFIRFLKSASKINFLIKRSDHVLVSTDELSSYSARFNKNLSMIPATIDIKKYPYPKKLMPGTVVIGWSGSQTTSKYLHLIDPVLKYLKANYDVRIMVMGDDDFELAGVDIELLHWTAESEITNLQKFDIGLHPLPDEQWAYGKSGGKLVQYMAAGIPIVATALGPNFKVIQDGYNGFLVTGEQEWIERLVLLITDHELRKKMGENSRRFAAENSSVEANAGKYLAVFDKL